MSKFLAALCAVIMACGMCYAEFSPTVGSQTLGLSAIGNARELGGYPSADGRTVKRGVLLRSAAPSDGTSSDFRVLTEKYNLAVMIDLRLDFERNKAQDPELDDVENLHLSVMNMELTAPRMKKAAEYIDGNLGDADRKSMLIAIVKSGVINDNFYVEILRGREGKAGYAEMFRKLLSMPEDKSLLFHCTQGKDRTGIAAMLILSALDVDEKIIMSDYLLTNEFNAEKIAREKQFVSTITDNDEEAEKYLFVMDHVSEAMMRRALDYLKNNYGSAKNYIIQELGITEEQITELQKKFLVH